MGQHHRLQARRLVGAGWRTVVLLGGIFGFLFFAGLWRERRRADTAPFVAYWLVMFFAMGAVFTFHAPHGAYYHSAAAWLPFALPMAVAATGPVLTALGRWWAFLRRPPTHRFVEVAAVVGAVVLSVIGSMTLYRPLGLLARARGGGGCLPRGGRPDR